MTEAPLTKMSPLRRTLAALGALTLASSLQACQDGATTSPDNTESHRASSTGPESTPTPQETSSSPSAAAQSVLIDVRTPEEFATGHLEGALNINFNADDFTSQIEKLDRHASYVVYCRSGNRAGQALKKMEALGFDVVINGGSVAQASDLTGVAVTQGA